MNIFHELLNASPEKFSIVIEEFLNKGGDVNIRAIADIYRSDKREQSDKEKPLVYQNDTPLILSARMGNKDAVCLLLDRGADVNAANDNDGESPVEGVSDDLTALYSAVSRFFFDIVEILLKSGARVHGYCGSDSYCDPDYGYDSRSLGIAIIKGAKLQEGDPEYDAFKKTVVLLLDAGANIMFCTDRYIDSSVLEYVPDKTIRRLALSKLRDLAVNPGINFSSEAAFVFLYMAISYCSADDFKLLLDIGFKETLHFMDNPDFTMLTYPHIGSYEAGEGHEYKLKLDNTSPEVIKMMLMEFDINAKNRDGDTTFMLALSQGKFFYAKVLLENNADIFLENRKKEGALKIFEKSFSDYCNMVFVTSYPHSNRIEKIKKKFSTIAQFFQLFIEKIIAAKAERLEWILYSLKLVQKEIQKFYSPKAYGMQTPLRLFIEDALQEFLLPFIELLKIKSQELLANTHLVRTAKCLELIDEINTMLDCANVGYRAEEAMLSSILTEGFLAIYTKLSFSKGRPDAEKREFSFLENKGSSSRRCNVDPFLAIQDELTFIFHHLNMKGAIPIALRDTINKFLSLPNIQPYLPAHQFTDEDWRKMEMFFKSLKNISKDFIYKSMEQNWPAVNSNIELHVVDFLTPEKKKSKITHFFEPVSMEKGSELKRKRDPSFEPSASIESSSKRQCG